MDKRNRNAGCALEQHFSRDTSFASDRAQIANRFRPGCDDGFWNGCLDSLLDDYLAANGLGAHWAAFVSKEELHRWISDGDDEAGDEVLLRRDIQRAREGHRFERDLLDEIGIDWRGDLADPDILIRHVDLMAAEISDLKAKLDAMDGYVPPPPSAEEIKMVRAGATKLRFAILERDGFRCRYCGVTAEASELRVDHVLPVCRGGQSTYENLVTACFPCNAGKSDSLVELP